MIMEMMRLRLDLISLILWRSGYIKWGMHISGGKAYFMVTELRKIPFLVHGFGTRFLTENQIQENPEWKSFSLVFLQQVHSDIVRTIESPPQERLKGDALLTRRPNLFLAVKTADCLPILIVSQEPPAIAAVHCGWRGTEKRLAQKAVRAMAGNFGCRPSALQAVLGPSIAQECYEVGEDVRQGCRRESVGPSFFRPHPDREGKYFYDLKGANLAQLRSTGMKEDNIHSVNRCTFCEKDLYSYRRQKAATGRMISFIGMRNSNE
jgi:YfiH family protein